MNPSESKSTYYSSLGKPMPEPASQQARHYNLEDESALPSQPAGEELTVPPEDLRALEVIAQRVGGDFGMTVRLGEPGKGSFFNSQEVSITLDPLHVQENPTLAKFVAGHEGAHRAITPGPHQIGLTEPQIKDLYSQIGFGYTQNVVEDAAVNSWLRQRFPGMEPHIAEVYNQQFADENAILSTPEVQKVASQLGYWPRFARYGSEVLRDWHQHQFSPTVDDKVKRALERTIDDARQVWQTIPNPEQGDKQTTLTTGRERFHRTTDFIWPEVKKLVEMDLHTEELRQMVNDLMKTQETLEQLRERLRQAQQAGDQEQQNELKGKIAQTETKQKQFNELSESIRQQLEEAIKQAQHEIQQQLQGESAKKQAELAESQSTQERLEQEIAELEQERDQAQGADRETIDQQIQSKRRVQADLKQKQEEIKAEIEAIEQARKSLESTEEGRPFPVDKLSEETMQELEKLAQNLPSSQHRDYRQKAETTLEEVEDQLNQSLKGQLTQDTPPSHEQQHNREKAEQRARQAEAERQKAMEAIQTKLEQARQETMSPYEQARAEVVGLIDDLYFRLRRILKPEEYGGEETGYPSGQILDMQRAMQSKYNPEQAQRLFIRETAPAKRDYRLEHLIDLSGSMRGAKIEETLKGFIVVSEATDRIEDHNSDVVTVHQGITGFHNRTFRYKETNQRLTKEIETSLAEIPDRTQDSDAGTDTYLATHEGLARLEQNLGETGNFLLTFTDGEPNLAVREKLRDLLQQGKEGRKQKQIKVGIIWLGESSDQEKLEAMVQDYGYDFGLVMPAVQTSRKWEEKNFAQALGDLLEDIVEHPEKY